ncbi:MAG: MATE family efflux transporter [Firmicutes bacterium]|nr:MATE family efflux transporter [Bacillota bacterium]
MDKQYKEVTFTNKALVALIIPLIIEQFLNVAVGLADSLMVASVGEAAVSAVSLVDSVNVLLIFALNALATGGAVVCGQFLGRHDLKRANEAGQQLLVFVVLLALGITAVLYAGKYFVLHGLFGQIEEDVMGYANTYFLIVEASIPFMALYSAGAAIFRVMGNSSVSMKISLVMNVINVCGNALLIFGAGMGVEGVAIPTLVSRMVAAVAVVVLLRNPNLDVHLDRSQRYKYNGTMVRNILKIGVPSSIESSLFQLGKIMLLSLVSTFGTASIAANAIGNSIATIQCMIASSIGVGMIPVVSQCVGAHDFKHARYYTKKLLLWAYGGTAVWMIVMFAVQPFIVGLYNVSNEAAHLAMMILWLHGGFSILMWPSAFTMPQALKGAGDTSFVMLVAVGSMWTFRIGCGYLFAKILGFGVLGVWYAMFIDWVVRTAFFVVRYRGDKWESKFVK